MVEPHLSIPDTWVTHGESRCSPIHHSPLTIHQARDIKMPRSLEGRGKTGPGREDDKTLSIPLLGSTSNGQSL